jgi:hypothetical protein
LITGESSKTLKPKLLDFKKLSVLDAKKIKHRSYAFYLPRCPRPKTHIIKLPRNLLSTPEDVKELWFCAPNYENGKPIKPERYMLLKDKFSAFYIDTKEGYLYRNDEGIICLHYQGIGTVGEIWLILVI